MNDLKLAIMKVGSFAIGKLPLWAVRALASVLGPLACRLGKKHRKRVLENLSLAFGDGLSPERKEEIARAVFKNLAATALEFLRIPWLKREDLEGYVSCEGLEHLEGALKKGKGVIILTGHFGNWELHAALYGLLGYRAEAVAREVDSPLLEEFVKWVRTRCGNNIIYKNRAMRKLLKALSENKPVIILLDQNVTHSEGVFVDFFGVPACTNKGPALLAASTGAAVVPSFMRRDGKCHRIMIGPEIALSVTGDKDADALENTRKFTAAIEDKVRRYPEEWFWVHRRWKSRPRDEAAVKASEKKEAAFS